MKIAGEIKILIADDHLVICKGVETFVKPVFENPIFSHAISISQLLSEIKTTSFDLFLLDVNYNDGCLSEFVIEIKEKFPKAKILIFTSGISFKDFNFFKKHVNAILTKQSNSIVFVDTIKAMFSNDVFLHSPLNQDKMQKMNLLTERELEVLECIFNGMGNKEIVKCLNIKESTVSTLRKRILEKLNLNNNVELLNFFTESIF